MGVFDKVELEWKGEKFVVPEGGVLRLIAAIEEHVTLHELTRERGVPLSRLAMAYAAALHHAGAKNVNVDEVYGALFQTDESGTPAAAIQTTIQGLLMMMIPPSSMQKDADTGK